jgi:hypothetical protein
MTVARDRSANIHLRLSDDQKELIEAASSEAGLSTASWVRAVALAEAKTSSTVRGLRELRGDADPAPRPATGQLPERALGVQRSNGHRRLGMIKEEPS